MAFVKGGNNPTKKGNTNNPHGQKGRPNVDWDAIRNDYIYGWIEIDGEILWPSYADLGKKYKIPWGTIASRGKRESWVAHQKEVQDGIAKEQRRLMIKAVAGELVQTYRVGLRSAHMGLIEVTKYIAFVQNTNDPGSLLQPAKMKDTMSCIEKAVNIAERINARLKLDDPQVKEELEKQEKVQPFDLSSISDENLSKLLIALAQARTPEGKPIAAEPVRDTLH